MKKLIPALCLLLVSAMLLGTSTFAWFSMNSQVTANGMSITAATPVNLLISNASAGTYTNKADATGNPTGKLYPASSANATAFNAVVKGSYIGTNGAGGVAQDDTKFQITSDQTGSTVTAVATSADGYWYDYSFYLKLSEATTTANVYLSGLTVTNAASSALVSAARVAIFYGDTPTLAGVYALNGANYAGNPVGATYAAETVYVATAEGNNAAMTNFVKADASNVIAYADANDFAVTSTAVKVTVRVWVEGQDTTCVNTNAGAALAVGLTFSIHNS